MVAEPPGRAESATVVDDTDLDCDLPYLGKVLAPTNGHEPELRTRCVQGS